MSDTDDLIRDDPRRSFISVMKAIDEAAGDDGLTVAGVVDQLDERAFGLLILLLAIPCLVPGLPGAQIIAIPIFLLAMQIVVGRNEPWLPGWFMRAKVKKHWISSIASFAARCMRWSERLARPRLKALASGWGERVMALFMALAAVAVMLPFSNTIPSLALMLISIGLIQRDGVFTSLGAMIAVAWIVLLAILAAGVLMGADVALDLATGTQR